MTEEKGQYAVNTIDDGTEQPVNIDARSNSVLNMGADKVRPILQHQVDSGEITEEQFDMVWWLFAYTKENGLSLPEISKQLNYDSTTTLYRVFSGRYGAKLDNVVREIARFRKITEERGRVSDVPFVETSIARKVKEVCNAAWITQSVAMIWGEPQTGKTLALEEFARANNHGATKYIRLPASAGVQLVARVIAKACYVSPDSSFEHLRDRILKSISRNNLIIIDEAHEAFLCYQKGSAIKVFEFLREIYDRTHCGMVLVGTNVLRDEIVQGKLSLMLRQFDRRGIIKVQLPDTIPMRDCDRIAKEWLKLAPPEGEARELVQDLVRKTGCNAYVHFLKAAAMLAAREKVTVNWGHFTKAYSIIRNLSEGK
jgi:DNA transposition AAA+ family ATPase